MHETAERLSVRVQCDDGATQLTIRARRTNRLPASSVFASRKEAAEFFQAGALGYSAMPDPTRFQGLELHCRT
ncbi:MAG: hypothetical protein JNM56_20820, partial [Planctomycetia bacterium]|nr:hypothetical protein [Planctomycetia bacterium]